MVEKIVGAIIGGILSFIGQIALAVFAVVIEVINMVLGWIIDIARDIFERVITQAFNSELFHATFLDNAWSSVKEFSNLILAFFLIIIALATILDIGIGGLSAFNAKKTIPKLIFIALAVNFSLVVSRFLLDIFQSPMFFIAKSSVVIGGTHVGIGEGIKYLSDTAKLGGGSDTINSFVKSLGSDKEARAFVARAITRFLMLLFLGVAFTILSIMFLIRVVALWFLLILAPIAWVISIMPFPGTGGMMRTWWSHFMGWAVYGFMAVFFMYITAIILSAIDTEAQLQSSFNLSFELFNADQAIGNMLYIGKYLVAVIGIWMALVGARKGSDTAGMVAGAVGGFIAGNVFSRVKKWGRHPTTIPLVGRGIQKGTGAALAKTGGFLTGEGIKPTRFEFMNKYILPGINKTSEVLSRVRGLGPLGLRAKVRGREMVKDVYKDYQNLFDQLRPEEQIREIIRPSLGDFSREGFEENQQIALERALKNNAFRYVDLSDDTKWSQNDREMIKQSVLRGYDRLMSQGDIDTARKLRGQQAPVFIEEAGKRKDEEIRAAAGDASKIEQANKKYDEETKKIISEMVRQGAEKNLTETDISPEMLRLMSKNLGTGKVAKIYEEWGKDVQDAAVDALKSAMKTVPQDKDFDDVQKEVRKVFAAITGNLFEARVAGITSGTKADRSAYEWLSDYVRGLRGEDFKRLKEDKKNMELLALHLRSTQVEQAGEFLSDKSKEWIASKIHQYAKTDPKFKEIEDKIRKSIFWT